MPKLDLSFFANFLQQTSDLKLSGNLDFSLRKFLPESLDNTFPGNLEIIPLWQNYILLSLRRFFPRKPQILSSLEI